MTDFPRAASEFSECSKICVGFSGRVCGRERKRTSDEDRKKGKKREVAGAMWGLEKGKRNGAVDLQPDVTKARKICLAFSGELEQ